MNADPEIASILQIAVASLTVIALLAAFAFGLKYFASRGWVRARAGKPKRLRMVEALPIDSRHRLAIVSCDGVEHLLLLGAERDLVVGAVPSSSHQKSET
jgi:flagellar protein FliO/FliZ